MTSLRIDRTFPAPPERVWHAFTDPAALAAWFWPASFATTATIDARAGGAFRIDGPGAGMAVHGVYVAVEPVSRLAFTWHWDGDDEETLVTIQLSAVDGHTALVLTHESFRTDIERDNHLVGWSDCLERLPAHLGAGDSTRSVRVGPTPDAGDGLDR